MDKLSLASSPLIWVIAFAIIAGTIATIAIQSNQIMTKGTSSTNPSKSTLTVPTFSLICNIVVLCINVVPDFFFQLAAFVSFVGGGIVALNNILPFPFSIIIYGTIALVTGFLIVAIFKPTI